MINIVYEGHDFKHDYTPRRIVVLNCIEFKPMFYQEIRYVLGNKWDFNRRFNTEDCWGNTRE